ncbi:MAG: sulfotransferase domain-containing protein [Cyanobacteriota bacterium]|nr:sulfotransferase domain-containing protein [Cyanobacteriota bacterium]
MKDFKLDLVGVGPQRTGSSWLYQMLQSHPALCFPKNVKETMFFEKYSSKGLSWYAAHFRHQTDGQICGEIGPTYFDIETAPQQIYQLNPRCKIIVNLRHPLHRALSLYRHYLALGKVKGSFSQAAVQMPRLIDAGKYSKHLLRWIETFGEERVFLLLLDDIESQPDRVLEKIYDFLKIESIEVPNRVKEKINSATMPRLPILAKIATKIAIYLRANRWHNIVELGKKLGLRKVYAGQKALPGLTGEEKERLLNIYQEDIIFVEYLTKKSLKKWYEF